jgi:hypothetical protein
MNDVERVNRIITREDLAKFVKDLSKECQEPSNLWENANLCSFLAALAAWIEDMEGYYLNLNEQAPKTPEWRTFAQMLAAAKYYE